MNQRVSDSKKNAASPYTVVHATAGGGSGSGSWYPARGRKEELNVKPSIAVPKRQRKLEGWC